MKKQTPTPIRATKEDAERIRKSESNKFIQLRVTDAEKKDVQDAANLANRTVTDYLLACHAAIASRLREESK